MGQCGVGFCSSKNPDATNGTDADHGWQEKEDMWRQMRQMQRQMPALQRSLKSWEKDDHGKPGAHRGLFGCTDFFCCVVFLGAIAVLGLLVAYGIKHGDVHKIFNGIDYSGNICGVDKDVADKPHVYWCPDAGPTSNFTGETRVSNVSEEEVEQTLNENPRERKLSNSSDVAKEVSENSTADGTTGADGTTESPVAEAVGHAAHHAAKARQAVTSAAGSVASAFHRVSNSSRSGLIALNLKHPMCVKECPKDNTSQRQCIQNVTHEIEHTESGWSEHRRYTLALVRDYPTVTMAGYCLPASLGEQRYLEGSLPFGKEAIVYHIAELKQAWPALAAAAGFAVVLGFVYLCALSIVPGCLIFTTLALSVLIPLVAGALSFLGWYLEDEQHELFKQLNNLHLQFLRPPATGNDLEDLLTSGVLVSIGLAIAIMACVKLRSIRLAVGSVDAACECMLGMPSLLVEPLLASIINLSGLLAFLVGFGLLRSCGEHQVDDFDAGFFQSFRARWGKNTLCCIYAVVSVWVFAFKAAMRRFVLGYCTQKWYFKNYVQNKKATTPCTLLEGICVGASKHLGSVALGAAATIPFRPLHMLHDTFCRADSYTYGEDHHSAWDGPQVSECLGCWALWDGFAKLMHPNAYVVVAIDALPFFPAAQKAVNVMSYQAETIGNPNSFMWIFRLWGVIVVAGLTGAFVWFIVNSLEEFNDESSEHYVETPAVMAGVGGFIGLVVGYVFMHTLRNIADTIVFCYALDKQWCESEGRAMGDNVPHAFENYLDNFPDNSNHTGSSRQLLIDRRHAHNSRFESSELSEMRTPRATALLR